MHQGSAKRDVADGVAALDALGHVLGQGSSLKLVRNGGGYLKIIDRTSGEELVQISRVGANTAWVYVRESNVLKRIQTESMKDVVSGIAALDAGGAVLAPGSEVKLTRDGSNNIELIERTSADIVARWTRRGVNDYQAYIHCGGAVCEYQHSGMFPQEDYSNHLGATDNFTSTGTAGNGTATPDAANHKMVLSTGVTVTGSAWFEVAPTYTLGSKPIVANYIVQSLVNGAAGERRSSIGFHDNFGAPLETDGLLFYQDTGNNWVVRTTDSGSSTSQAITALANGDHLTIVATSSDVRFYVNGVLLFTSTTNIPTAALQFGAGTLTTVAAATTARTIGIDLMSIKTFV
jgi:hypothetical protein